jgi:hypothetical protein
VHQRGQAAQGQQAAVAAQLRGKGGRGHPRILQPYAAVHGMPR